MPALAPFCGCHWLMRKMTNSAGLTTATPISVTTWPRLADLGRVGLGVALDVEGLLGRGAEERARAPDVGQKGGDVARDLGPQVGRVGLEDDPLRALVDGLAQEEEEPADVDVLPLAVGVAADGARAPDADVAVEVADAVDALRVEAILLRPC